MNIIHSLAINNEMAKQNAVGGKQGAHTPVQMDTNARSMEEMMKKRIALCQAET